MIRIYLIGRTLICFDKGESEFKQKYGKQYEQVATVKELSNLQPVLQRLTAQYRASDVVQDVHIKRKTGWCYKTEEQKAITRSRMSDARIGYEHDEYTKKKISDARKGKGNFRGKTHHAFSKKAIAFSRRGKDPIQGKRWCHSPRTGKELRVRELPEGFVWGRDKSVLYMGFGKF